jgi:pantetheine-phosphate adenylyltransferase
MAKSKKSPAATERGVHLKSAHGRLAVYTGSFDPMTLGHLDVIHRASGLFDRLIVAIGEARDKNGLFPVQERVALITDVCADLPNVTVETFKGLAVDFAREHAAVAIIRGLRSSADYSYEMQMALMNRALASDVETIFLPTSPQFSHISSSLAKEIALHGGDLNLLVPPEVAKRLAAKVGK